VSYRAALLRRWSRRDVLAVLVVAASVAFLTGSGLVGHAASTELAGVAAEFESPASVEAHPSPMAARRAAGSEAVVLTLARATRGDGRAVTVVGVPARETRFGEDPSFDIPARPPSGTVRGPVDAGEAVTLRGEAGTIEVTVVPRSGSDGLPDRWYVASPSAVRSLGPSSALTVSPGNGDTPVLGVLSFFLVGSRQVLQALGLATGAAAVLLAVTVFGATRMTVRDRTRTLRVARATGARPRTLLALFGARAALQAAVGVAGGYAVGVIAPNAAVNAAVFLGQETTLSLRVERPLLAVLVPAYVALVGVGALGGVLAALPAVRRPPATLTPQAARTDAESRLPSWFRTTLLDWRAVVPTATTLGVFLAVAVLVAATAGVVAPLAGGDGATITKAGATHPFASTVPASYATELRVRGTPASGEILALGVTDGHPYVARGANFSAFAQVTPANVTAGREPARPGEAVAGEDLARTLDLSVGDTLLVGGSTRPAIERVHVVGTFRAPDPFDDQLVVTLATARDLAGKGPGQVQFVRTTRRPDGAGEPEITVMDVSAPDEVPAGRSVAVSVSLLNPTERDRTRTVRASVGDEGATRQVELAPGERATVALSVPAGRPRNATLQVAEHVQSLRVLDPDAIRLVGVPDGAPPGSQPVVRVVTATGSPVAGATVRVGNRTMAAGDDGRVRVPLSTTGQRRLVASTGNRTTSATVEVRSDAPRAPRGAVSVVPADPTPATRPTATVALTNPWNRTISVPLSVTGPGASTTRTVTLAPDERTSVALTLARRPAGTYEVTVRADGETLTTARYEVAGDPRLAAALATSGRTGASTGVGRALATVLGNVELVVATVLLLAALMTIGGTTAGFASAVHARRRTLGVHRAMGATPRQVFALVLGDAVRVGAVATALALALAGGVLVALDAAGLLTLYGVRVLGTVDPLVLAGAAAAAFALALGGAGLATLGVLRVAPSSLLSGANERRTPTGGPHDD
jgi:ABC-type lipoprotein release transport system permease subunit